MRLHRLTLTAIGPFAEPVEIDLDKLSASGIFLLEGPTGAGKSTLIDAIVFALYGDVAGRASSTERMASAVAPPHITPSVELDFSTTHGLFRIQRTPKHERSKRRGTGSTTQHASAKLWRLTSPDVADPGEPVSTRIDEIGAEVADIIGLSREQFVQTVVLPQGEFATFLRADAEHRRALLQRLFGTEIYDRTVERLIELRRKARQRRTDAASSVRGSLRAYCGASGTSSDDEDALVTVLEEDPDQLLVVLQQQVDAAHGELAKAEATVSAAAAFADRARTELAARKQRESLRVRLLEIQDLLAALDATEQQHAEAVQRLRLADEAARLMPLLGGLVESEGRATAAHTALGEARAATPSKSAPVGEWSVHERVLRTQIIELNPLVECERGLADVAALVATRARECDEVASRHRAAAEHLKRLPASIAGLRKELARATGLSALLPATQDQCAVAQQRLLDAQALEDLITQSAAAASAKERARRAAQKALDEESQLRARFIDGIAGLLAADLKADTECPVCGSREHPRPASSAEGAVDHSMVEEASARSATTAFELQEAAELTTTLTTKVTELRRQISGVSVAEATDLLGTAEAARSQAQAAEADAVRLASELADAEVKHEQLRASVAELAVEVAQLSTALAAAREGLTTDQQRVADAADEYDSVAERVQAMTFAAESWADAVTALRRAQTADDDVAVRLREWQDELDTSTFASREAVHAAGLSDEQREELRDLVERRVTARAECTAALQAPELNGLDPDEQIDVTSASETSVDADALLKQAQEASGRLRQRAADSEKRATEVQTSLAAERTVMADTEAVIRMADLASASTSDNARSMSLPTYVLRERFVDVVASANDRLATMSDGRYRLEHLEDKRGNRRSGLELQVRDTHTERPRDPATLSGGESFYCSLALALGLADVVTAEAGGVDLGTLFVDEGFGSLDADTLEHVLGVLNTLASSGRAVGIVSHVPELKEQIAERISVIPNRDGSSRLVVAA